MITINSTKDKGYIIFEAASANITPAMITDEQKVARFVAQLQEAEEPNRNNRIYSKNAIDGAIKHYSVQEKLKTKTLYGRLCPSL